MYLKSIDRHEYLKSYDICFLGVGVSGGPGGALSGPAIMVGGSKKAWKETKHIFNSIAASNGHNIACNYFGSPGSGHFVKLVHNGIEYALMGTLAETTNILMKAFGKSQNDQSNELNKLLNTNSSSYLLELTSKVLNAQNKDNQFFIDQIDSKIDQNGTGIWTVNAALELNVSIPAIYSALSTRSISSKFNFNGNQETNISNKKIGQSVDGNTNTVYINPLNSLRFVLNELKKDKVSLDKDFYVFTGSTVGVVPILGKGLYTGKVAQLGSAKAIIH